MRVTDGVPWLLDRHLARVAGSLLAHGHPELPREQINADLAQLDLAGGGVLRIVAGGGRRTVALLPLPERATLQRPLRVETKEIAGYAYPHKSSNFELNFSLMREAAGRGLDDVLIVDSGELVEAATANVLLISGESLVTPSLTRCLPGVVRGALLEVAGRVGLRPEERRVDVAELASADEVIVSNSVIGAMRVGEIDGQSARMSAEPQLAALVAELQSIEA